MARTVVIEKTGGPEVLQVVEREVGAPGPGEVRIRHAACGLNFIDVYQRTGLYPLTLPHALGMEAAGVIEAVGDGVTHLRPGDRAAYAAIPPGAYAEARVMPAAQVCPLPEGISFEDAASIMLQGMTVEYLFHRVWPLEKGQTVLFHAAAGGVGLLACQWARSEGIRLIGTAGTDEKCALAVENGADICLNYRSGDFVEEVKALTGGAGVDVVMDGVGQDTFERSLDCLKPLGMMISFGNASGPVPPVSLLTLAAKGSLKLTRTTLFTFLADHARCQAMARHLFDKVESGVVRPNIGRRYPLEQIAEAHRALEARATTGSTVITL
ncbi:quinone oxidoreductase family protein [Roseovarius autotrophicus]|uniref:quinone oxidoreductase family protein n=1 Tax=Roseovarius autotrophicus TaxID=2824121 RepID=UPI001B376829|nr:quinone oxidoreductase [Roseovarius autotrophicus]